MNISYTYIHIYIHAYMKYVCFHIHGICVCIHARVWESVRMCVRMKSILQHPALQCILQQGDGDVVAPVTSCTTNCNTLQHTATRCIALQHTRITKQIHFSATYRKLLQTVATHCNALQHALQPYRNTQRWNALQHAATQHCNTLQHTAPSYNTPAEYFPVSNLGDTLLFGACMKVLPVSMCVCVFVCVCVCEREKDTYTHICNYVYTSLVGA